MDESAPLLSPSSSLNGWRPHNQAYVAGDVGAKQKEAKDGSGRKKHRLSFGMTVVFIMAEMTGAGMMAFPKAFADSGWLGVAMLVLYCFVAGYAGILLGRSWLILEERWAEYRSTVGNPYGSIAERAIGPWMRIPVSISSNITLLGTATVFILLISRFLQEMIPESGLSFCIWILILSAVLLPITFLAAPHDFWFMGVAALATTVTACILAFVVMWQDYHREVYVPPPPRAINFNGFFLSMSTFAFTFGGASAFPTFQNDMKKRELFPKAVVVSYTGLLVMFLSVGISGFLLYGSNATPNILETISPGRLRTAAKIFLLCHLFSAFQIMVNTPCQEIEQYLGIPRKFTWKRAGVRTMVMIFLVFVSESIPDFGKILNLVGAIASNVTTLIFPTLFYLFLCGQEKEAWPSRKLTGCNKFILWMIILLGIATSFIGSYSSLEAIFEPKGFSTPCYMSLYRNYPVNAVNISVEKLN